MENEHGAIVGINAAAAERVGGVVIDTTVQLPDGRTMAYTVLGAPDAPVVFYFHGAPSSRLDLVPYDEAFQRHGVRVVCPDRPAYGGSSPQTGRQLVDWPADVSAVADELGVSRFAVFGLSSGGPYVAVCAALLPERVTAAAIVAGVTDVSWPGFFDDYGTVWPDLVEIMRCNDEVAAAAWCDEHYGVGALPLVGRGPTPGPHDMAFLQNPASVDAFRASMREAVRQGPFGFAQDITIENQPWQFDLAAITAPVTVLHGETDVFLPVGHSRHTASIIPGATFELVPDHGHVSVFATFPRLARELADTASRP